MLNWLKRKFTQSESPVPEAGTAQMSALERCAQLKDQGNEFLTAGQLKEAEKCYRQALTIDPNYAPAHNNLGHVFKQQGLMEQARKSAQTALSLEPNLFSACYQLAMLARDQGQMVDALKYFNRALEIKPDFEAIYDDVFSIHFQNGDFQEANKINAQALNNFPESAKFHYNAGMLCARRNDFKQAIVCLQQALQFDCENIEIIMMLARVFESHGDTTSASTHFLRAYQLQPDSAEIHAQLGFYYLRQKEVSSAITSFEAALKLMPDSFEILDQLAPAYIQDQRLDDAVNCYERILYLHPDLEKIHYNLGLILKTLKMYDKAELSFRAAIKIKPDFAMAYSDLSNVLCLMNEFDAAEYNAKKAIEIDDKLESAHFYLGDALHALLMHDDAIQSYQRAIEINPKNADACCNIGTIYFHSKNIESANTWLQRALACDSSHSRAYKFLAYMVATYDPQASLPYFQKIMQLDPNDDVSYSSMLFELLHCENIPPDNLFDEHRMFGRKFESPETWPEHTNTREPSRQLQIGFVSGDFYNHVVINFFEPILKYLAHYSGLSLHAYYNFSTEDDVTKRLRKYFPHWHDIVALSHDQLAEKIRDDKIDILIDLSGHTVRNRLRSFALKPAPVQITWVGYPGTTGLQAMDYFFSDKYFTPHGMLAAQFTEKLVNLPSTPNFLPRKDTPDVNLLPALSNGYITFGSFNRLKKLNASVIALWAQLLRAIPTSRLLLYGTNEGIPNPIIQWFENEGIAKDRIIFYPNGRSDNFFATHNQVDICLDSFPYAGGTTTKDALMMGVPTLTLPGPTPVSRMGAAFLGAINLTDFIATDKEDFVKKGVAWSNNISELARIRAGLRAHCASFSNQDPKEIAASIEQAFRMMWQRWCAGLPAVAFDAGTDEAVK